MDETSVDGVVWMAPVLSVFCVGALWSHNGPPLGGCALIIKVLRLGTGDLFETGSPNSARADRGTILTPDFIPWHRGGRAAPFV